MQLNFQTFGESGPPLIIVHGLFGSIANWRTVARELAKDCQVYVIDQRNHGDSPQSESMTYRNMADDLDEFIRSQNLENFILCGHSMGGKAAMVYALSDYSSLTHLQTMIVLDIAPEQYSHSHAPYLAAMGDIDLQTVQSRADVEKTLQQEIPDQATRLFLMQSLEKKNDEFRWKLNVPVLHEYMPDIVGFPHQLVVDANNTVNTLFLSGSKSDYVLPNMHQQILQFFPSAQFATVEAGHWLHVEQRTAVVESIRQFLNV